MLDAARRERDTNITVVTDWASFVTALAAVRTTGQPINYSV